MTEEKVELTSVEFPLVKIQEKQLRRKFYEVKRLIMKYWIKDGSRSVIGVNRITAKIWKYFLWIICLLFWK